MSSEPSFADIRDKWKKDDELLVKEANGASQAYLEQRLMAAERRNELRAKVLNQVLSKLAQMEHAPGG